MNNFTIAVIITDCFIELLSEKPIDKISIMEITKKANISRVTFYNYFQNKEDILDTLLEQLLIEFDMLQKQNITILENLKTKDSDAIKSALYSNTLEIVLFFHKNQIYINALLKVTNIFNFMDILHSTYYNHFMVALPQIFSVKFDKSTIANYSIYMTTGVKAIIEEWFLNGFKQEPEVIAEHILAMLAPSLVELYTREV